MAYPKSFVARVKGALRAGLRPKQLAYLTGIPHETIKEWATEDSQAAVEPDLNVLDDLRLALIKRG